MESIRERPRPNQKQLRREQQWRREEEPGYFTSINNASAAEDTNTLTSYFSEREERMVTPSLASDIARSTETSMRHNSEVISSDSDGIRNEYDSTPPTSRLQIPDHRTYQNNQPREEMQRRHEQTEVRTHAHSSHHHHRPAVPDPRLHQRRPNVPTADTPAGYDVEYHSHRESRIPDGKKVRRSRRRRHQLHLHTSPACAAAVPPPPAPRPRPVPAPRSDAPSHQHYQHQHRQVERKTFGRNLLHEIHDAAAAATDRHDEDNVDGQRRYDYNHERNNSIPHDSYQVKTTSARNHEEEVYQNHLNNAQRFSSFSPSSTIPQPELDVDFPTQISYADSFLRMHSFPFASVSQDGLLKVHPKSISFENDKIAVLLSKPGRYSVSVKQIKIHAPMIVTRTPPPRPLSLTRPTMVELESARSSEYHHWVPGPESPTLATNHASINIDYVNTGNRNANRASTSTSVRVTQQKEHEHEDMKDETLALSDDRTATMTVNDSMTAFGQRHSQHVNSKIHRNSRISQQQNVKEQTRTTAAITIQSRVKGWLTRVWYRRVKDAVIIIQTAYRRHKATQRARKKTSSSLRLNFAFFKSTTIHGSLIRNLKLEECDSVILLGGNNPIQEFGANNTAREIYQLHTLNNMWSRVGEIPEPRVQGGAVLYFGYIIFFGGADPRFKTSRDKNVPCDTTWCLKIIGGNWKQLANMRTPRSNFGYILCRGKIWVFGGIDAEGNALSACEMYDPQTNIWTEIASMDGPRLGVAVATYADNIWIIGGLTKNPKVPILKSVIVYNVNTNTFTPAPAFPFPRAFATATSFYTKIFLFAGAGKIGSLRSQSLDDVSIYENGHWESIAQLRTARHGHCQLRLGKYVLVLGGINSQSQDPLDTCEVFNMKKYSLSTKVSRLPKPIVGCCGIVID